MGGTAKRHGAVKTPQKGSRHVSGRKPAHESRATEFRHSLTAWKRTPESSRPSLRALARELGTSHQLLTFHLERLDQWQANEYWRQAREIRARAIAEDRSLNQWEEQQVHAYTRAGIRATVGPMLLDVIKRLRDESERRPLVWQEIKSLKVLAPGFPEARDLLQKCSQSTVKARKNNLPAVPCDAAKSFRRE
jgi:hypothetical protein